MERAALAFSTEAGVAGCHSTRSVVNLVCVCVCVCVSVCVWGRGGGGLDHAIAVLHNILLFLFES